MARTPHHRRMSCRESAAVILAFLLAGCSSRNQPVYEDSQGFRFAPPPGWVERARDESMPARSRRKQQNLPLPPLGVSGIQQGRFLVRYDRISIGHHAWLRVAVADLPSSTPLKAFLSTQAPGWDWKRESEEQDLEVSGLPAARITFAGRWYDRDYLCETLAVRKGEKAYLFSAALPTSDANAREQVRQAVFGARWQ